MTDEAPATIAGCPLLTILVLHLADRAVNRAVNRAGGGIGHIGNGRGFCDAGIAGICDVRTEVYGMLVQWLSPSA